jgi:hypothetical protein
MNWKGSCHGLILRYYLGIFLGGQKNHEKPVRIAGLWVEIFTQDLYSKLEC